MNNGSPVTVENIRCVKLACHQKLSRGNPHQNFVVFCAAYAEFCATPLMADNRISCVHSGIFLVLCVPNECHGSQ